ncbi:MAG: NAD(P)H-hydrate epimerase [Ruminococcus sp.]|nr:NAD(P)H-hydrate epimerase [Ruminococcus sp.]
MENVITVKNMRESDEFTINTAVSGQELMKRAAQGVFDNVLWKGSIAIICGSGNNGGDGFALAEILIDKGFSPVVLRVSEKLSADGAYYYKRCVKKGVREAFCDEYTDLSEYDIIVDCILGTGFSGTLKEDMTALIELVNRSSAYVVSVDINSGLSGKNGIASPVAVRSDLTVSIGYYKTGMFLNDAGSYIGSLLNVDIGIKLLKKQYYLISASELSPFSGYGSVCITADEFARRYAIDEGEFRRNPLKVVSKESEDSKSVFIIDYNGSKMIVDQTYIYFQSDKIKTIEDIYSTF